MAETSRVNSARATLSGSGGDEMKWGGKDEQDRDDYKVTQISIWLTLATFVCLWIFVEFPFTVVGFVFFALAIIIGVAASCGFLISGLLKSLKGGKKC